MIFIKTFTLMLFIGSLIWIDVNDAYPSGAPPSACKTLTPVHKDNQPQNGRKPYDVTVTKRGNGVEVKIFSPYGEDFQGFVMQARSAQDRNRLIEGKFSTVAGVSKTVNCLNGVKNTITQVNKSTKSEITTEWIPAKEVNEDIVFRATVAQTFQYFWIEIDSVPVRASGSSSQNQNQNKNSEDIYDDCFINKGCFGYPSDCVPRQNCDIILSYVDSMDGVLFTMQGLLDRDKYMATGLSLDTNMGDDSVTECFIENNRIVVQHSWNERRNNTPLTEVPDGRYEWQIRNGIASCSWKRPYVTWLDKGSFNLKNDTYYILVAKGPVINRRVSYHEYRLASQEAVNFTAYEMIEGANAHDAVKVHGTFMVTGWIALVSIAILMARHFKTVWDDQMLFGVKLWFAIHRGVMIVALLFIVVAFIVIFVHKKGWNYGTGNPHAVLGCIATALGLFQPIMAAFRPSPDHPKRPIFNWLHWAVGNGAQIIAIITIFFAVSLQSSGLEESFYWVMGVFVIVHYCVHAIFQVHAYSLQKKKNNEIKMQELGSGQVSNMQSDKNKALPPDVFKVLVLGVYGIFLIVVMLALYSLIGTA